MIGLAPALIGYLMVVAAATMLWGPVALMVGGGALFIAGVALTDPEKW